MRKRTLFCRKRQYRRIFFRTLVALIALNIFACALLFHILHGVMSRNQVRETYQTNLSLLEQADYSVVQVIFRVCQRHFMDHQFKEGMKHTGNQNMLQRGINSR